MNINQLKRETGLSNKQIAEFFELSYDSYTNSTAKPRYQRALIKFYQHFKTLKK
jgi:hypothetical protein